MALTSFFVSETWLSAQGDEAKTVELAPSGFDVKSFPRQSRCRGGGIDTVCKSTLGSSITFTLPILMLLYIMLYIVVAYLMLYIVLAYLMLFVCIMLLF